MGIMSNGIAAGHNSSYPVPFINNVKIIVRLSSYSLQKLNKYFLMDPAEKPKRALTKYLESHPENTYDFRETSTHMNLFIIFSFYPHL